MESVKNNRVINILFFCTLLITFLLNAPIVSAGNATLSWDPPTTNADGTPLTDLDGYKIYYGTSSGSYSQNIDVGDVTIYTVSNLSYGTYYFAVTAYDSSGNESEYSNEVSKTIQSAQQYTLTINKTGTGSGTVTAPGINCGSDCTEQYNQATVVTLTATPATGSAFAGWSGGGCTGTGTCSISINTNTPVIATFNDQNYQIGITVTSPNGGETLTVDSIYTIRWAYTGDFGYYVKIELLEGGSVVSIIAPFVYIGSNGSGSYNWWIPSTLASGTDYRIRVTSISNSTLTDTSNGDFSIPGPSITVSTPNGGESWSAGSTQTIRWTYTGDPGYYVNIELLKGGALNQTIASYAYMGSGGSGSCNWTISSTQPYGNDYSIRVTTNTLYTDTSNANFTISGVDAPPPQPASITVSAPNGGERWGRSTVQYIQWNYTGNPGSYLKVDLMKGRVKVATITDYAWIGSNGSGFWYWWIPSTLATGNYTIKITSTSNNSITDTSGVFYIIE